MLEIVLAALALAVLYIIFNSQKRSKKAAKKRSYNNMLQAGADGETHIPYQERLAKLLPKDTNQNSIVELDTHISKPAKVEVKPNEVDTVSNANSKTEVNSPSGLQVKQKETPIPAQNSLAALWNQQASSGENENSSAIKMPSTQFNKDDSVFDVTGQSFKIPKPPKDKHVDPETTEVVPWPHFYVFGLYDLEHANKQQKAFYKYFKNQFLSGECLDLRGFDNYAFILMFDLLNAYEKSRKPLQLEQQLLTVSSNYPKTKPYCLRSLLAIMLEIGDEEAVERIELLSDQAKLGSRFRRELGLDTQLKTLLNSIEHYSNNFFDVDQCQRETLRLFCNAWKALESRCASEGISLSDRIKQIASLVAIKIYKFKDGSDNFKYTVSAEETKIPTYLLKFAENKLREFYGHKRKLSTDPLYENDLVVTELNSMLVIPFTEALEKAIASAQRPDSTTEIVLNEMNTSRWKAEFEDIERELKTSSHDVFMDSVMSLGMRNKNNPSKEMIYYEAAKAIGKVHKPTALALYVHYIYADLNSSSFDNRQLTKNLLKSLFTTLEQEEEFGKIIQRLVDDKNLDNALDQASLLFQPRKKKIILDKSLIGQVQQKHAGTVQILGEYLTDDEENQPVLIDTRPIVTPDSPQFTQLHLAVITMFKKHNFSIAQEQVIIFAKEQGVFHTQLVDGINEMCYELLDDLLIEEEDDQYIMSKNYYSKIFNE